MNKNNPASCREVWLPIAVREWQYHKQETGKVDWDKIHDTVLGETGLDINKEAMRATIRRMPVYKGTIEFADKRPAPESLDLDEYYEELKKIEELRANLDTKQTKTLIRINDTLPIGIAFFGDLHIGAVGVNYSQWDKDRTAIINTPGLYAGGMGDLKENQNSLIHAAGVNEQTIGPSMQDLLVQDHISKLKDKLLWLIRGCHDDWDKRVADIDFTAKLCEIGNCVNLWHGGGINIQLGEQLYKIRARHKYKGESDISTTNAQRRLLEAFGPADIVALAHKHYPDLHITPRMEQEIVFLRSGSYKVYDEFGQKLGGYRGKVGVPVVVFYPDSHKVVAFKDLYDGITFLTAVRQKYGH